MTLLERIQRVGQGVEPGWDERDVERVWQGLRRKRRRRAVAAGASAAAVTAAIAVWIAVVAPDRHGLIEPKDRSAPALHQNEAMRFADGSMATPWAGHEGSLAVVEDTPARVVVSLARGGARFDVIPRPARLFVVRAGEVTVSVLGTGFSVERVADRVGVTVTRGAVRVDWGAGARRLAAGEEGWFPPLVVSPGTEAPPDRHESRPGRSRPSAENEPPARASRVSAASSSAVEPPAPAEAPAPAVSSVPAQSAATEASGREAMVAAKLLADADRARLAGRFEEGVALLDRLVREHPHDERAPLAAFSLGRILLGDLGRPAEAARAFARARALAPDGPMAEDALAREVEALVRAGDPERARAVEAESHARTRTEGGHRP